MTYNAIVDLRNPKRFKQPGKKGNADSKMDWTVDPLRRMIGVAIRPLKKDRGENGYVAWAAT